MICGHFLLNTDTITHQYEISQECFKNLRRGIKRLKIPFSSRYNAAYGIDDFVRVLVQMSTAKQFTTSSTAALAQMNIIKSEESEMNAELAGGRTGRVGRNGRPQSMTKTGCALLWPGGCWARQGR